MMQRIARAFRWWSTPARYAALYYFLFWAALASYGPFLNVHYAQLGLTGLQIGILGAFAPLMRLTVGPVTSSYVDRHHRRRSYLTAALLIASASVLLLRFAGGFWTIFLLAGLMAVAGSSIAPVADSIIARMAVRHKVDFGQLRVWGSLGFSLFSLVFGAVWGRWGMSAMFFVGAAFLIPVALMAQRLEEPRSRAEEHAPPLRLLARDPGLLALFATTFLVGCGEGVYLAYSGIFMDTLGGGELLVGAIFGLSAICELPTMPLSGRLARRIGKAQVLWLSYLVMALSYFGYALTRAPVVLLAFAMLKGVGFGLYGGIYVSLADERVPEVWSSTTQSILAGLSFGLAPLLSIPLLGWLSDVLGIAEIFWVAGALEFLAVLVMGAALLRRAFDTAPLLPSRAVD